MARRVKDARLDTRAARSKLEARQEPHWRLITEGRHLGYYKGARGGTWVARFRPPAGGAYVKTTLGKADDTEDADGVTVLGFAQATEKARAWFEEQLQPVIDAATKVYTVKDAVDAYIEFLKAKNSRTAYDTGRRLDMHLGKLMDRPVGELGQEEIERWHRSMIRTDAADPDRERRSKDSANRVLTMFKAALNRAYADPKKRRERFTSADAWRETKPFKGVGRSRQVHLDRQQCQRLINACDGAFRNLVTATLLTGARPAPGELAHARVRDFRADLHILSISHSKTGPRDVTLTAEAVRFFEGIAAGRPADALLLPKDDGTAWGGGHQIRPMIAAVKRAKLPANCCLYSLRHTHASQCILAGMNLKMLAENMGTSIRMLEQHYGKFIAASRRKLVEESAFKLGLEPPNIATMRKRAAR